MVHLYNFKGSDVHWSIDEIDTSDLRGLEMSKIYH